MVTTKRAIKRATHRGASADRTRRKGEPEEVHHTKATSATGKEMKTCRARFGARNDLVLITATFGVASVLARPTVP
jgi:hypothetical protein